MKKHLRGGLRLLAFLLGFALLLAFANRHFIKTDTVERMTIYEMQQRSDIELAFVGSSIVRDHFNVQRISEQTGLTAFNATVPMASMPASIAVTKELLRTNSPEWIVLVTEPYNFQTVQESTEAYYKLAPYLSDPGNRLEYYLRTAREDGLYIDRLLMFRNFGADSLSEIAKTVGLRHWPEQTYERLLPTLDPTVSYQGGGFLRHETDERATALVREGIRYEYTGYQYALYDGSKAHLREFMALCEESGAKLMVAIFPSLTAHALAEPGFIEYNESLMAFCRENGIPCFNFSYAKPELMPCLDEYFYDLYHMVGEGADILSDAFSRVFSAYAAGEDVSALFYENRWQYVDAIDFITNAWVDVYRRGDRWSRNLRYPKDEIRQLAKTQDVFLADCSRGTYVVPEYRFVLRNADGSETLLRDYSEDGVYTCDPGALDGQTLRVYARAQGTAQAHWYDLAVESPDTP